MSNEPTKAEVITLGCRLNAFESEVVRGHAAAAGLTNTYIVNTCAVTAEAERQARQTIRRLRRKRPDGTIIVSGCAAQINPDAFAAMPEVDWVLGNEEKLRAESYILNPETGRVFVSDIMETRKITGHLISGFGSRTRSFIQIQQGCNHRCTFCIIPFGRGNSRSVPIGFLANQVRGLVRKDYKEFVLTGVDISSYGSDLPGRPSLGEMVRRLLDQVPQIERLRLSSLDPAVTDDPLVSVFADEPRLMPHIHLSIQAGNDTILKRMKRRHSRGNVIELCERLRRARPDLVLGADIIAGFPTETDTMFEDTLKLIDVAGLTYLHVFPYSVRKGTPAASMPLVPKALCKERAAILRKKGDSAKVKFFDQLIGSNANVLSEAKGHGYTEHYAPVIIREEPDAGYIHQVRITGRMNQTLTAELLP